MKNKNIYSVQDWLPFKKILNQGIIQLKNFSYVKILKVSTINFQLKSDLEKQAILNSYKIFLKTCNFNLQILIQSNKKDLSKNISKIKEENETHKNKTILDLSKKYINFINELNTKKETSEKYFYIIIKEQENKIDENIIINNLNEKFYKIKECLSRCGNYVFEIIEKKELLEILYSFLNFKIN